MNTEDDPIEKMEDITGLMAYTPEHDRIMQIRLEVVKNVYCGTSRTPHSHGSGSVEAKEGGFIDYGIWNNEKYDDYTFSVAVPKEIGLAGYEKPDYEGYVHPIRNEKIATLAEKATGQKQSETKWAGESLFTTVVDSPRNGDNCRFGFKKLEHAEKFIALIEKESKN